MGRVNATDPDPDPRRATHVPHRDQPPVPGWALFTTAHSVGDVIEATVSTAMPHTSIVALDFGVHGYLPGSYVPGDVVAVTIAAIDHSLRRVELTEA